MKNMPAYNFVVQPERRICTVGRKNPRTGYFHCWEHFSEPVPAGLTVGSPPAGVISYVVGIVEFADGVERVDPTDIQFIDEDNAYLQMLEKHKEDTNGIEW